MIRARITFVLLKTSSSPAGSTSPMSAKCRSEIPPPHEQLRGAALREREFGDPLVGKVVIEAVDVDMSFHILPEIMRQSYYFL